MQIRNGQENDHGAPCAFYSQQPFVFSYYISCSQFPRHWLLSTIVLICFLLVVLYSIGLFLLSGWDWSSQSPRHLCQLCRMVEYSSFCQLTFDFSWEPFGLFQMIRSSKVWLRVSRHPSSGVLIIQFLALVRVTFMSQTSAGCNWQHRTRDTF